MSDHNQQPSISFSRRLIAWISVIVPRRFRARFRREWEAELEHREARLARWDRLDRGARLELTQRSLGAFWDALRLQPRRLEDEMFQDLRYGARLLLKNLGFTIVAVFTLSFGIGANTAIFTLLDKVLIRPLPVEQPNQLVTFVSDGSGAPGIFSYPLYTDLRDRNDVLSGLVAYFQRTFNLSDGNQTERVVGQIVSGNYFSALGARPALGRF